MSPRFWTIGIVTAVLAALVLCACAKHVPFALPADDRARFGDRVLRVPRRAGDPLIFGLNDCTLFKARTAHDDITGWDVALASDWGMTSYPKWMTGCTSQTMSYRGGFIVVSFCAQALGAGGGCAGGDGTYRSRTGDAESWSIAVGHGWAKLPGK